MDTGTTRLRKVAICSTEEKWRREEKEKREYLGKTQPTSKLSLTIRLQGYYHLTFMFHGLWYPAVPQILGIREMEDPLYLLGSRQLLFTIRAGICSIQARSSHIILALFHFPCFYHHQVPSSVKACKQIKKGCKMHFRQKRGISWCILAPDFGGLEEHS